MSKNVTGVMVMNQDGMPVIVIIIFNCLIYFFVLCLYISTLCSMFAFAMKQDRMPVIVIIIFNIGHFGHRYILLDLACFLYVYIYTLYSTGCFLLVPKSHFCVLWFKLNWFPPIVDKDKYLGSHFNLNPNTHK